MTQVYVPNYSESERPATEPLELEEENPQERGTAKLEEQVRLFRLLNQINREIGSTLDLSRVLASACQLLGTTINCSRASILVKDNELDDRLITRGEYIKDNYKRQLGMAVPVTDNPHLKAVMSKSGAVAVSRFLEFPGLNEETKELAKSLSIRSMLTIATRYQGQVNGVIGLQQCDREREWTVWEKELLEGVASQLGIAINQAQIYTAARAAAEREALLRSVTRQISSTLDLNTILQTAVKGTRELLDTDRMLVYQFKENWLGEIVVEDTIAPWPSLLGQEIGDNCFSAEHANLYQQGRLRAIDDIHRSGLDSCHIEFLDSLQVKANLIAPIIIGSGESSSPQLWGLLIAHECRAKRHWKNEEIEWLRQIADEIAIAVNQAQLYQETRAAAERESLLRLVTERIRSSLECSEILQTAVSEARQLLQSDRVLIYQFRENWHGSVVVEETIAPWNSILGEEVADDCFSEEYVQMYESGRVRPINDIREAGLDRDHFQFLERLQVRANLIVPILIGRKLWGLLIAHECNGPRHWQPEESQLLRQLAEQLAIAIQQAELFEQVQDSAAKYQAQARELQATLAELRSAQVQLIQSVKLSSLGQMVAGIAHEINNANNFIRPNLFYTRDYTLVMLEALSHYAEAMPEPPDEIAELLEEIEYIQEDFPKLVKSMQEGSDRIRSIVETLRNFAHLDEAESKEVDLNEGLESSLAMLQHRLTRQIVVRKEYGELPLLECRPGQINQVFYNILQNALDAIEEKIEENGGTGELTIRTWLGKMRLENVESSSVDYPSFNSPDLDAVDAVIIAIRDSGAGIAPETQERIFDPFFTTKEPGKGTGLGLSLCYQVTVKGHGGCINCITQPGRGAEFLVKLPLNYGH